MCFSYSITNDIWVGYFLFPRRSFLILLFTVFNQFFFSLKYAEFHCYVPDPAVKTRINQLQKQVKEELKVESLVSWEKFCHSISLENNSNESWRKIKNFLEPKGQRDYPALQHANKVAKTNADKAQLFAESVERHFGIESDHFDSNHFDEVNKFIEDNH